jgi:hypothetical protein
MRRARLTDLQALVFELFDHGIVETPADVSEALKITSGEAERVCGELEEKGAIVLNAPRRFAIRRPPIVR